MSGVTRVSEGNSIDYTPGSNVSDGDIVVQGQLVGVATKNITASVKGALAVSGVFDFPKAVLSTSAISAGAKLYWDDTNDVATATVGSNVYIGKAVAAATAAATTVRVRLDQ